ncbi:MAG: type I DNA topoisomerase [Gemmatimonadetes bacterium]|nr:type I DNA topoisomerase [Gemmatimonadota bacterium]
MAKTKPKKPRTKKKGLHLVVVESPAKARTIGKYLGGQYEVAASVGHVRDLPLRELGVNVEAGFEPKYVTIRGKGKILQELKRKAKEVDSVILATDPDREGEAIAFHVAEQLGDPLDEDRFRRVRFHEITRDAVLRALEQPGPIDVRKVEAQQARRILDRLVGYQASPFLWKPIRPGLSAGRVQTVALRLICEREEEIRAFTPQEYWSILAQLEKDDHPFQAKLHKIDGKAFHLGNEVETAAVVADVRGTPFVITDIKRRERRKNPAPPFTTSTLQQEAAKRLGFSAKRTMALAQQLYEGVELGDRGAVGLITYMRTDSTRVAAPAVAAARGWIDSEFGRDYVPDSPRDWSGTRQKAAQEAHEAVRPTDVEIHPDDVRPFLEAPTARLYELIWLRFVASQMAAAIYDTTTVDFDLQGASGRRYLFRATGSVVKFAGFTRLYQEAQETGEHRRLDDLAPLPPLATRETITLKALVPEQHFTQPPPRFTEASLVKELERLGIGRPSTYAHIISTLRDRQYVEDREKRFHPTELGETVTKLLVRVFPDIFDVNFTSQMEEELDSVEEGERTWRRVLEDFYGPFQRRLREGEARSDELVKEVLEASHERCSECGRPMIVRWNRYGRFLGCSGYPECRHTRSLEGTPAIDLKGEKCPDCGGQLVAKRGRFGAFVACTNYPECRYTRGLDENGAEKPRATPTDEKCEKCGSPMVARRGRYGEFLACSAYPKCKNTRPLAIPGLKCPKCQEGGIAEKRTRRGKTFWGCTRYPQCDWSSWDRPLTTPCPNGDSEFLLMKTSRRGEEMLLCPRCGQKFEPAAVTGERDGSSGGDGTGP